MLRPGLSTLLVRAATRPATVLQVTAYFSISRVAAVNAEQPNTQREQLEYDLCIVGAGPAGLSAAIRFKQVRCILRSPMEHVVSCKLT